MNYTTLNHSRGNGSNEDQSQNARVPSEIARSWLLINETGLFDQSAGSRADSIILDIEDAVDPSQKDQARGHVVDWLSTGGKAWVRINDTTSPFWAAYLAGLRGTRVSLG